jgi:hypothetical protein
MKGRYRILYTYTADSEINTNRILLRRTGHEEGQMNFKTAMVQG